MTCDNCGHFNKCASCCDYICEVCGAPLLGIKEDEDEKT